MGGAIAADGIVTGAGQINGRPVMVGAEDFHHLAGTIGPGGTPSGTGLRNWRCGRRFR